MLAMLSPAKTMDFDSKIIRLDQEKAPLFTEKTRAIIQRLRLLDVQDIMDLMQVSSKIAETNHKRIANFSLGTNAESLRPAILAFKGDTYKGLDASTFSAENLKYSENSLLILSGLYGLLSPLTLIEPYRCEMGLKFDIDGNKKLSAFWRTAVTSQLNRLLSQRKNKIVIDLASTEYMAAVDKKQLEGTIIDIIFKENRNDQLKTIPILSKKARGMMARFIVKEKIENPESLKDFNSGNYIFNSSLSENTRLVFVR